MSGAVNILLVEDDEVMRMALRRAAARAGLQHPLHEVCDGLQALQLLRGAHGTTPLGRPRCVVLDLNLPRMDGLELLRTLREEPVLRDCPVFVLTTSSNPEDLRAAFSLGVAGYFVKARFGTDFSDFMRWLGTTLELTELPGRER